MGQNETRAAGTCGIWFAVMVVGVAAITNAALLGGVAVFLIVATVAGMAAAASQYVWNSQSSAADDTEKVKRRSRVDRVLDKMSQTELDELRSRLAGDSDGEVTSMEDLLTEQKRRQNP